MQQVQLGWMHITMDRPRDVRTMFPILLTNTNSQCLMNHLSMMARMVDTF